jgi:mannose-1-phosphate guanylyltransferase
MTESVVLLGAAASRPEVEYGWIEAGACISPALKDVCRVRGFREKPGLDEAKILLQQGGLWNTFVMVGHVGAFRSLVKSTTDDAIDRFRFWPLWSRKELVVPAPAYDGLRTIDFSRDVLAPNPSRLLTLKLSDSGWTDLGQPDRVIAARQQVHRGLTSESGIHENPNRDARHVSLHA